MKRSSHLPGPDVTGVTGYDVRVAMGARHHRPSLRLRGYDHAAPGEISPGSEGDAG